MKRIYWVSLVLLLSGCADKNDAPQQKETKIRVVAPIYADPAFVNITQELVDVYESINDSVDFKVISLSEELAIRAMIHDSIVMAITSRALNRQEQEELAVSQKISKEYLFAQDAIAFVVNTEDKDTVLSQKQILEILISNSKNKKVVFEENYSSGINYITELLGKKVLTANSFATKNTKELLGYVADTKNTLGIIGSNVFSNLEEAAIEQFFSKIKLVGIAADQKTYYPFQSDIAAHKYPFARNIYIVNAEHYYGKYSGFKNFVIGSKGQRIILKSGLMPINMPTRLLNFVKKRAN